MEIIDILNKQTFIKSLKEYTDGIYLVGGIVRDHFLNKESKDIDLLVTQLEIEEICDILTPYGKIDDVGESFSVIKFLPYDMDLPEPIDIAIPRKDVKIDDGHKGFEIVSDPFMSVESDLERRDITINSIAISLHGESIIDPFNGLEDMKNGVIKATSKTSFIEDPLRMLRIVQFASRFKFSVEEETFDLIQENKHLINDISPERVVIELDKIFFKGDKRFGVELLFIIGLYEEIFDNIPDIRFLYELLKKSENLSRGDFYYALIKDLENPYKFFVDNMKGDLTTANEIKALLLMRDRHSYNSDRFERKFLLIDMIKISKNITNSVIAKQYLSDEIRCVVNGCMPTSIKDLKVTGEILMAEKGFKQGKELGEKLKELFRDVIMEERENTLERLLDF